MLTDRLRRPAELGLRLTSALSFLAPLVTRVVLGVAFVQTGLGKLQHHDNTTQFFAGLGLPAPGLQAWFIGALELVGGACLVAGLFTRVLAALLSCTMIVALLTADREDFVTSLQFAEKNPLDVVAFAYLLFLGWLVLFGPGALSLDTVLRRRMGLARTSAND